MAQIGIADHWKVYIVNKSAEQGGGPAASTSFTDYTDHVISWRTQGSLNKLGYFEAVFIDITTATEKADVTKGNLVYIMSGTKLVGKYVLGKPKYNSDYSVSISGFQSSGTIEINRKLISQTMPKISYDNCWACDILKSQVNGTEGILVDANENKIIELSSTHCGGGSEYLNVSFDYQTRVDALNKLANTVGKEWWVDHGTNDTTPYSEGDTMNVGEYQGDPTTSSYTFYTSGSNQNSIITTGAEEIETNANQIIVQGQDKHKVQVESNLFDGDGNYTCMTTGKGLDGWLAEDLGIDTPEAITMTAYSMGSLDCQTLGGANTYKSAIIKIDDEFIKTECLMCFSPPTFCCITRGCYSTQITPHKCGTDIVLWAVTENVEPTGQSSKIRLYVCDSSCLYKYQSYIRIGSENIGKYSCSQYGTGYILIGQRDQWCNAYAHGDGIIVRDGGYLDTDGTCLPVTPTDPDGRVYMITNAPSGYSTGEVLCGRTSGNCATYVTYGCDCRAASGCRGFVCVKNPTGNFTIAESICGVTSHASYTTWSGFKASSIIQCGLYTKVLANNTAINKHMLDKVAEKILLSKRLPTLKVTISPEDPATAWENVDLGDMITIADGEIIGLSANEEVRVTGFEYSSGEGEDSLVFYCNNKDVRNYPSIDTNYVDEKEMSEQPKQQYPLREYDSVCMSSACGCYSDCYLGMKQLKYVACPCDDFDAANKIYVDTVMGGGGKWCCTMIGLLPALTPCNADYNIVPNGIISSIGLAACPWLTGRFGNAERYLKLAKDVGTVCLESAGTDSNISMDFQLKGSSSCYTYGMCGNAGDHEQYWLKVCAETVTGGGDLVGGDGKVVFQACGDVYNDVNMDFIPGGTAGMARICGNLVPLDTAYLSDRCLGTASKPWSNTYSYTYCACGAFCGCCAVTSACIRSPIICSTGTMLANVCICAPYGLFPCVCTCCRFKLPVGNNMYG